MRARLRRRLALWALARLEPEMGEWRRVHGKTWRLSCVTVAVHAHGYGKSELVMRYVQPVDYLDCADC